MRAAIYARYSSDLQRDASIEDQVRACRARIEREGWSLAAVYSDHGVSGATRLRPGYQKLLADARRGAFDVVLAEALDRLSRDQEDTAALYKQLSFAGVTLVTLAEGEISELHVGLKGTMNALFLKDLAQKTRRGLEGRVRQGRSGGGLCYGYAVVRRAAADGAPETGLRAIDEAEAAVVRRVFAAFAAGSSPRVIALSLNREGLPGPGGRPWSDTTIRGHATRGTGLLHNELYRGRLVWNRQRYVKDPRSGKRLARPNPEASWVVQEVPELRIVDEALWAKVEARLAAIRGSVGVEKARAKKFWEKRRPKHLLTGLAVCGACGGPIASVGRHYLSCGRARRQGTCDSRASMPRAALEEIVLSALKRQLMAPDLAKAFIAAYHAELNRQAADVDLTREAAARELAEAGRKLDGLIEAIADGFRAPGLQAKLDELERRRAALETTLASTPQPAPRLHPNLAELYRRKVARLHAALQDPEIRDEALDLLRSLVSRVTLRPIEGGFEVELEGEIANMVALPGEGQGNEALRRSVKVVAGAGFGTYLTEPQRVSLARAA